MTGIRTDHRMIGLASTAGVAILGLVVLALTVIPFGTRTYTALIQHTAGLRIGEQVQIAGVGVGEVRSIALDDQHVKVGFTVSSSVHLGPKSTAAVKVATLLGTHYLDIEPQGTGELPHDQIALAQTSVPYNLQDVVDGSAHTLDSLDGAKISQSMKVLADALRDTPADTRRAIDGVSRLSEVAAKRSDQMAALLTSTREVTGDLADNSDEIIELMKQSTLVLQELTSRRKVIDELLVDSRRLATEISGVLKDSETEIAPLMKNFTIALDALRAQKKELTASIDGLSTMAAYFANATGNGPWLDGHVALPIGDNLTCSVTPGCAE